MAIAPEAKADSARMSATEGRSSADINRKTDHRMMVLAVLRITRGFAAWTELGLYILSLAAYELAQKIQSLPLGVYFAIDVPPLL